MVRKNWWRLLLLGLGLAGLGLSSVDQAHASHSAGIGHYHTGVSNSNCNYRPGGQQGATFFRCEGAVIYGPAASDNGDAVDLVLLEEPGPNAAPEVIFEAKGSAFWDKFDDDLREWLEEDLDRPIGDISRDEAISHTNSLLDQRLGNLALEAVPSLQPVTFCLPFDLPARYYGSAFTNRVEPKEYQPPLSANSGFEYLDDNCNRGLENKTVFLFCHLFSSHTIAESLDYIPTCYLVATERTRDPENPELIEDIEQTREEVRQTEAEIDSQAVSISTSDLIGADPCSDERLGLNWVFCHLLEAVSNGVEKIELEIYDWLRIDREDYQGENCGQANEDGACGYRDVWASIRNLVTLAIVGTALVMVIATALDFGWFSNYTVKKYLARLIAGVILVQLSWAVGDFIITLGNQLGEFIGGVITGPFAGGEAGGTVSFNHNNGTTSTLNPAESIGLEDIFNGWAATGAGGALIGAGVVVGFMAIGGAFSLIGVLFTVAIGFLMFLAGFMFLVLRQFIVVFLLAFAPMGVAFWFLPGSDKFWKLYYKTFISLVMIYPIIVAVIAAGRSFIWVLLRSNHNGWNQPVIILVAFLVYVGMFAAIPFIFKRFLGAVNQLTGTNNNPAKGLIDRMRNARKGYMDRNKAFRRGMQDQRDDKTLRETEGSHPLSLGGVRRGAIQAKRSFRYGLPLRGARGDVRQAIADQRQIEQAKRLTEARTSAMQSIEVGHGNDNESIAQVAEGIDPSTGQAVTEIYQEAAIKLLIERKQYDVLARLHATGSTSLRQAWASLSASDAKAYRELQDVVSGAGQAKVRKDQLEATVNSLSRQYGFDDSDQLVQLIASADPAAASTIEIEAAIGVLAKRRQAGHVRQVNALRGNNQAIDQAYKNVANDGTLFDNFNETDYSLARNQVGSVNFAEATEDQIATQGEKAIDEMEVWLNNTVQSGNLVEAKRFVSRIDRVVNNEYKRGAMPPVTRDRLVKLRNQHVATESRMMAPRIQGSIQQIATAASNNTEGLEAEIGRHSAMRAVTLSTESSRNREVRRLCRSTDPVVNRSLETMLETEGFNINQGVRDLNPDNLTRTQLGRMGPVAARVIQAQLSGNQVRQQIRADNNLRTQIQTEVRSAAIDPNIDPETVAVLGEIDNHLNQLGGP